MIDATGYRLLSCLAWTCLVSLFGLLPSATGRAATFESQWHKNPDRDEWKVFVGQKPVLE